jgi:hypothetical protein
MEEVFLSRDSGGLPHISTRGSLSAQGSEAPEGRKATEARMTSRVKMLRCTV